jgi:hypothetical protein
MKGGARLGAGRPRKRPLGLVEQVPAAPVPVPAALTPAERQLWAALAPHAERQATLVLSTIPGFTTLVRLRVEADRMWETIRQEGYTCEVATRSGTQTRAHPLLSRVVQLEQRCEQQFARFALIPNGKPVGSIVRSHDENRSNPWNEWVREFRKNH